jgi:hypothetical protein
MYQSTGKFMRVFVPEKRDIIGNVTPWHYELRLKPEFNPPSIKRSSRHIPPHDSCSIRDGAGKCRMCMLNTK